MSSVIDFLKRASDRNGFKRERFEERKIPTDYANLTIMPFFGDLRSTSILSMLLLHRYRQEIKGSKYFIFASWPGLQGLFPYVDEYWSITEQSQLKRFYELSDGFKNKADLATIYTRNLNEFFSDVVDYKEIIPFYNNGLTNDFFVNFKEVKRFFPFIPSIATLGKEFNRELATKAGYKVFIHPSLFVKQWNLGESKNVRAKKEFWIGLVNFLLERKYCPVIWQNEFSYDISQEFVGKCLFTNEKDMIHILATMRATGCVLDVFNGLSRLAIMARCPFLTVDERIRYSSLKEYEIDDLCANILPKKYIFTFSTIVTDGEPQNWQEDIFPKIVLKLDDFLPNIDRDACPSSVESTEIISYDTVRKIETKKFGTRLLKIIKY